MVERVKFEIYFGVQLPKDGEKEDLTEKVTLLWDAEKDEGSSR